MKQCVDLVKNRMFQLMGCTVLTLVLVACSNSPQGEVGEESVAEHQTVEQVKDNALLIEDKTLQSSGVDNSNIHLFRAAPPDTFVKKNGIDSVIGVAWDRWAWQSFASLNWPALVDDEMPTGYVRGIPDMGKSIADASSTDMAVWETFKEKREVFNNNALPSKWQSLTFDLKYLPTIFDGGEIEQCGDIDEEIHEKVKKYPRIISQISKANSFGMLDETAEVASPAQESQESLCAGHSYKEEKVSNCDYMFKNPTDGGSTSEYSATEINTRPAVGPRVFKDQVNADNLVFYEVKVNFDYYKYVSKHDYYLDEDKSYSTYNYEKTAKAARKGNITLPYRTSAMKPPSDMQGPSLLKNRDAITQYSAEDTEGCYKDLGKCSLKSFGESVTVHNIPQTGSIQLKAAWLPVELLDGDKSSYHTTNAIYYQDSQNQPNGLCYNAKEFGLIGLHIIQRVHNASGPDEGAESLGGTFIFATWEHDSVNDGNGYSYVNYLANSGAEQTDKMPYPNTGKGIAVKRIKQYPMKTTRGINFIYKEALSKSVWANYHLVGTQFKPVNEVSESQAIGQPYYLANLVIETNRGLQQFQGLPPGVSPISKYSTLIPSGKGVMGGFNPTVNNVVWQREGYNMGGCMGCHGVAQAQGYNFSFVLQDGDKGTTPDTARSIAIPPIPPPQINSLEK